ncbi:MAG: hypothetical protein A2X52_05305 [Candidatus Rokubacteria bacterium GWC2_70_16]|nr:MAG: hypothetical protein A2X52_05305 [Candidatus Rokubacteria bacterium GWC2_70_16]
MLSGTPGGWRWIASVLSLVALAILSVIDARRADGCPIAARRLSLIRHGREGEARMTSSRSLGPTAPTAPPRKLRGRR